LPSRTAINIDKHGPVTLPISEKSMNKLRCNVCGHGVAESLGQIPDCGEFAGQVVAPSIRGGELWKCMDCGSMFRYPTLSPDEYLAYYEKASSGVWEISESKRKDFATINAYLSDHVGGSILDIGCYAGVFLSGLPGKFHKFGLEPSKSASVIASSKGISILGRILSDLDTKQVFDVVVAIDVIEHVLDVESFLADSLSHVNNNGLLVISTGNPDCFYWRKIFKARFWYNSFAEHLVFPSYKYFCEFSKRHNLPAPERIPFKYEDLHFFASIYIFLHQLFFAISPVIYRALVRMRRNIRGNAIPKAKDIPIGTAGIFTDHQVIIFRKRG
jgi:SAM-dependent methyltransferase